MSGRQNIAVAALIACVLVAGFFSCFERKTMNLPTPISLEAARNPYLATSRLLEAMGHEVVQLDGLQGLDPLPPLDATLIITTHRHLITERRSEVLLDWAERGGHLILRQQAVFLEHVEPGEELEAAAVDLLLDPFGLRAYQVVRSDEATSEIDPTEVLEEVLGDQIDEELVEDLADLVGLWNEGPARWDIGLGTIGEGVGLEVAFGSRRWALPDLEPLFTIGGSDGLHLITLVHGGGFLTAVTDEWFLRNSFIGDYDHAEAVVHLARMGGREGPVYIMLSEGFPGFFSQVLRYALPAALSLLVLIGVWIWRSAPRFGPVAPDPPLDRRQWIEHLEAVGNFHWRRNRASQLIRSNRAGVLRLIERRHPALARLPTSSRDRQVAELTGLHRSSVRSALDEREFPSAEANVARTIYNLERIRSSL